MPSCGRWRDLVSDAHELSRSAPFSDAAPTALDDEEVARYALRRPSTSSPDRHVVVERSVSIACPRLRRARGPSRTRPGRRVVVDDVEDAHFEFMDFDVSTTKSTAAAKTSPGQAASACPCRRSSCAPARGPNPEPWMIDTCRRAARPRGRSGCTSARTQGAVAGKLDALEELGDELLRIVQELLHKLCSLPVLLAPSGADRLEDHAGSLSPPASTEPMLARPCTRPRPRIASIALGLLGRLHRHVGGPLERGRPWSPCIAGSPIAASRLSVAGTRASSRVFSPSDAPPGP